MLVNLYHPAFWIAHGHCGYLRQNGAARMWKGATYEINDSGSTEGDFVVVHDDIDKAMKLKASLGGFVLVTGEEKSIKQKYHQDYLDQFDLIITSRDDIAHPNVTRCHYLHPWRVNKNYDDLSKMDCPDKTKTLSAIISSLTALPSHKERFTFIHKLKGHYKDDLDWFSKGGNTFLPDKWDGLAAYQYSVAIENSSHINYFTEKITDCFLACTMPFYSGCPNIKDFFDERSFISIDPSDVNQAIEIIDQAIKEKLYDKNVAFVMDSRALMLEKYHFIAALTDILQSQKRQRIKVTKTIRPQVYFNDGKVERLLKGSLKKLIGR